MILGVARELPPPIYLQKHQMKIRSPFRMLSLASLVGAAASLFAAPAIATGWGPTYSANCYFFRDGELDIAETCLSRMYVWSEGGLHNLIWNDGVVTEIQFGRPSGVDEVQCEDGPRVDGWCSTSSYRDVETFELISTSEFFRLRRTDFPVLTCVDVVDNSICWRILEEPTPP
jgi:hypothetical protein